MSSKDQTGTDLTRKRRYKDREPSEDSINVNSIEELKIFLKGQHGLSTRAASGNSSKQYGLICKDETCMFKVTYYKSRATGDSRWNKSSKFCDHSSNCNRDKIVTKKRKILVDTTEKIIASTRCEAIITAGIKFGFNRQISNFKSYDRFGLYCGGRCGVPECRFKVCFIRSNTTDEWLLTTDSIKFHDESTSDSIDSSSIGIVDKELSLSSVVGKDNSLSTSDNESEVEYISYSKAEQTLPIVEVEYLSYKPHKGYPKFNLSSLDAAEETVQKAKKAKKQSSLPVGSTPFDISYFFKIPSSFNATIAEEKSRLLLGDAENQLLKTVSNIELTREQLRCLLSSNSLGKEQWISGDIINAYFHILQTKHVGRVAFATTGFMPAILKDEETYYYEKKAKSFFSVNSEQNRLNIFNGVLEYIVIPINILSSHWVLIFIDMINKKFSTMIPWVIMMIGNIVKRFYNG